MRRARRLSQSETTNSAGALAATLEPAAAVFAALLAFVPLLLLGALLVVIIRSGPANAVRGENFPPVERLTFQRVTLERGAIHVSVMNDGPDDITIAQVQVDDAFWTFTADNGVEMQHLGRTSLRKIETDERFQWQSPLDPRTSSPIRSAYR